MGGDQVADQRRVGAETFEYGGERAVFHQEPSFLVVSTSFLSSSSKGGRWAYRGKLNSWQADSDPQTMDA